MTTIAKILVRDCAKQVTTAIEVANGQIFTASYPTSWTLEFVTSDLTHTPPVYFSVDGSAKMEFESRPYCPTGHNAPLGWKIGSTHSVVVQIDTEAPQTFAFSVAVSPPSTASARGTNLRAITDAFCAPNAQMTAACTLFGLTYIRQWLENQASFVAPWPSTYWKIPLEWKAAGKKVIAQSQFWKVNNSPVVPTDADWVAKWTAIPDSATTGVWGISLGNECNNRATYFNGNINQLAHLMQLAYPILHGKGYAVIAPSFIGSIQPLQDLQALGAYQFCDYIDYHVYEATAAQALSEVDAYISLAKSIGKPPLMTECGIRGNNSDRAGWAAQTQTYLAGLATRALTWLYFPFVPLDRLIPAPAGSDGLADDDAILDVNYGPNEPFYTAMVAAFE